ncbi:Hypothetical predicted protein [Pelobates cultripes]|uniref:Uncharacterized protein n=1 Tax=Pelobates cultripes TaxID=61616 RepID=A0AAD1SDK0_PELCU|nr:Hypothetical predicted protein [Pelobates cultripes]
MTDAMWAEARETKNLPAANNIASRHILIRSMPLQNTSTHHDAQTRRLPSQLQRKNVAPQHVQAQSGGVDWRHSEPDSSTQQKPLTPSKRQLTLRLQQEAGLSNKVQHYAPGITGADKAPNDILSKIDRHFSNLWLKLERLILQPALPHEAAYLPKRSPLKHTSPATRKLTGQRNRRRTVPSLKMALKSSKCTQARPQLQPGEPSSNIHKTRAPTHKLTCSTTPHSGTTWYPLLA